MYCIGPGFGAKFAHSALSSVSARPSEFDIHVGLSRRDSFQRREEKKSHVTSRPN